MAKQIPCGQQGCGRLLLRNGDRTKHIRNHHLSRFNIQPIITHLQHSAPPLIWSKSNSPPPQDICTHEHSLPVPLNPPESPNTGLNYAFNQDDAFRQPDQPDADMDYPDKLLSPNCDEPHLPNEPPSSLKPGSPPSPHLDPPQPLQSPSSSSGSPRVSPGMSHIFHPTINGKSSSISFFIDY